MAKKPGNYYIDKDFLFDEILKWKTKVRVAQAEGKEPPRMPDTIGKCILDVCNNMAKRPNFCNYPHREEMIGDAIVACVNGIQNSFDENKSKNAFGYLSQITWFAFLNRITAEKKKHKHNVDSLFDPTTTTYATLDGQENDFFVSRQDSENFYYMGK